MALPSSIVIVAQWAGQVIVTLAWVASVTAWAVFCTTPMLEVTRKVVLAPQVVLSPVRLTVTDCDGEAAFTLAMNCGAV